MVQDVQQFEERGLGRFDASNGKSYGGSRRQRWSGSSMALRPNLKRI